jgi:dihydrofolate reductase
MQHQSRWEKTMAKIVYSMNQSLDGYVDHDHAGFLPNKALFRHYIDQVRAQAGGLYGARLYQIMQYWDEDQPGWDAAERDFAAAWRGHKKWVASKTMAAVGPNATLVHRDPAALIRRLKAELEGEVYVGGTRLAHSMAKLGLIDEYRLYLHPVVLGKGTPFFRGARPPLRLVGSDTFDGVIRLTYVPA